GDYIKVRFNELKKEHELILGPVLLDFYYTYKL
ncbi:unnamed protein product, partial [marine sediment metagenome]